MPYGVDKRNITLGTDYAAVTTLKENVHYRHKQFLYSSVHGTQRFEEPGCIATSMGIV